MPVVPNTGYTLIYSLAPKEELKEASVRCLPNTYMLLAEAKRQKRYLKRLGYKGLEIISNNRVI